MYRLITKKKANLLLIVFLSIFTTAYLEWGFYAHRLINETAVFTLPKELLPFYKTNIDYIMKQSVAPDKRRYASPLEGIRHYIDLDNYGLDEFNRFPTSLSQTIIKYASFKCYINGQEFSHHKSSDIDENLQDSISLRIDTLVAQNIYELMEFKRIDLPLDLAIFIDSSNHRTIQKIELIDHFSEHGILPFHLVLMQYRLSKAYRLGESSDVLRLSSELGHYIADACVPLHTTSNYNGQQTKQNGIHAFWESRIPELFAEKDYDLWVEPAVYISNPDSFYRQIIVESFNLVKEVLDLEIEVKARQKPDELFCFVERNNVIVRTECETYALAYQDAMNDMVENRMRRAIHAIGSAWYTAWIDAGAPKIEKTGLVIVEPEIDSLFSVPIPFGNIREHENQHY